MASRKASTGGGDSDEGEQARTGPVADGHLLYAPTETRGWLTLKEGYLIKTKVKTVLKSTKLRWFVLKQHPTTFATRLEYYEGMSMRGAISLERASIQAHKDGVFLLITPTRTFVLQAEKAKLAQATDWVLALQQAILSCSRAHAAARTASSASSTAAAAAQVKSAGSIGGASAPSPSKTGTFLSAADVESLNLRGARQAEQLDGSAIDAARWAALRKSTAAPNVEPDPDDEDLRALREAEEAEERRQEEERLAWLATLEKKGKGEEGNGGSSGDAGDGDGGGAAAAAGEGGKDTEVVAEEVKGDVSEEEDYEEMMRAAEQEEERRQQAEREAFLATKGQS